jgi:hypothetical protein
MYEQRDEELPHEVILAIQRILDVQPDFEENDPLATLSNDFSRVDMLNEIFPDGEFGLSVITPGSSPVNTSENSLSKVEAVQAGLVQNELELQREIDALQLELERDQDPTRMQLIQETISVSVFSSCPVNICPQKLTQGTIRNYWVKCHAFVRKRMNLRQLSGISPRIYRFSIWLRKTLY